jgi:ERCC4-type nuclease
MFKRLGIKYEETTLETADFVKGNACVERKTADDFASSIMDGRLFEQAKRMREEFENPVIVISGKRKRVSHRMTIKCLIGAMASIVARLKVPIVTLSNDRQLVNFSIKFLEKATDGKGLKINPKIKKVNKKYNYRVSIIGAIPGIGFDKAKKLFTTFGSIKSLAEASINDLTKIEGIGKSTAEKILKALN